MSGDTALDTSRNIAAATPPDGRFRQFLPTAVA